MSPLSMGEIPEKKKDRAEAHKETMKVLREQLTVLFGETLAEKIINKYQEIMSKYWLKGKEGEFQPYKWGKIQPGTAADYDAERLMVEEELVNQVAILLANRTVMNYTKDGKEFTIKKFNETWIYDANITYVVTKQAPNLKKEYLDDLHYIDKLQGTAESKQKELNKAFCVVYETKDGEEKTRFIRFPEGLTNKEADELTNPKNSKEFLAANVGGFEMYEEPDFTQKPMAFGKGVFTEKETKVVAVWHSGMAIKLGEEEEEKVVGKKVAEK